MVEKSGVEKFLFVLGLKGLGLKLGVEKSGVEMSFNCHILPSRWFSSKPCVAYLGLDFGFHETMKQRES